MVQAQNPGVGVLDDELPAHARRLGGAEGLAAEDVDAPVLGPVEDPDDAAPHPEVEIRGEVVVDVPVRIPLDFGSGLPVFFLGISTGPPARRQDVGSDDAGLGTILGGLFLGLDLVGEDDQLVVDRLDGALEPLAEDLVLERLDRAPVAAAPLEKLGLVGDYLEGIVLEGVRLEGRDEL